MRSRQTITAFAALAALLAAGVPASAADFPTVVREILAKQTTGPLTEMSPAKRSAMTDCVVQTLGALPNGKKRLITEGADFETREHAFGKVVDENHAEWRKKIAKACSEIAVAPEDGTTVD